MGLRPRINLKNEGKDTHNGKLLIKCTVAKVSATIRKSRDLLEVLKTWRSLDEKRKTTKREDRIMMRKASPIALRLHRKIKQRCRLNMVRVSLLPLPDEDWERLVPTAANQVTICTTSEQFFLTASEEVLLAGIVWLNSSQSFCFHEAARDFFTLFSSLAISRMFGSQYPITEIHLVFNYQWIIFDTDHGSSYKTYQSKVPGFRNCTTAWLTRYSTM